MLDNILIFLLFLGPLVFFHELGHFLFARLFGVRVEVFSIGFGPKLFKKKWGETEYAFSLIPLGGYVKMFGEDLLNKEKISEEDKPKAYNHKNKWQRFWIIFGGPLANFILTFTIFFGLFFLGETVIQARVGTVESNSIAAEKGFRSADEIIGINKEKLYSFSDLSLMSDDVKSLQVQRAGEKVDIELNMTLEEFANFIGTDLPRGLRLPFVANELGELLLLSKDGTIDLSVSFEELLESKQVGVFLIPFKGKIEDEKTEDDFDIDNKEKLGFAISLAALRENNLYPAELRVYLAPEEMPAAKSGMKPGDIITHIGGEEILDFDQFRERVQGTKENESLRLSVLRDGKKQDFDIEPSLTGEGESRSYKVGVQNTYIFAGVKKVSRDGLGFVSSIQLAAKRTYLSGKGILGMIKNLFLKKTSLDNLGGPLAIGKVATDTFYLGVSAFLSLMAMFSMNLGLLNLLPIPVLDGGHILFISLELLNGGSLSKKKMMWAQQFGFMFLMLIMFFALFNDVKRFFFF